MVESIVAVILGRDDDGDHLALDAAQRPAFAHQFEIQVIVVAQRLGMDAVDLDDVVAVLDLPFSGT